MYTEWKRQLEEQIKAEQNTDGSWTVVVRREHSKQVAEGRVHVTHNASINPSNPPHMKLAAAHACFKLASSLLEVGDSTQAIELTTSAIEDLADDYMTPDIIDDTVLKFYAAKERAAAGAQRDAAEVYLRVLKSRLHQYCVNHSVTLDELEQ